MFDNLWRGNPTGYRRAEDEEVTDTFHRPSLNPFGDGGSVPTMDYRPYRDGAASAVTPAWTMLDRQHSSPITPTFSGPLTVGGRPAPLTPDARAEVNRTGLPTYQSAPIQRAGALAQLADPNDTRSRTAGRDFALHELARNSEDRRVTAMELARTAGINPERGPVRMMTPREEAEHDLGPQKKRSKWRILGETVLGALYGMGTGRGAIAGGIMGATGDLARQVRDAEINKRMGPLIEQRAAMEAEEEKRRAMQDRQFSLQDRDLNTRLKLAQIDAMKRENLPQAPKPLNPIQMWEADLPVTPEMAAALNLPKEYIGKRKSDFKDPKPINWQIVQTDQGLVRVNPVDGSTAPVAMDGARLNPYQKPTDAPRPSEGEINAQRRVAVENWSGTPEAQQYGAKAFESAAGMSREKLNAEITKISNQINALSAQSAGATTTTEGDGIATASTQASFTKTNLTQLRARHEKLMEALRRGEKAARQEIERQGGIQFDRARVSGGTGGGQQPGGASRIPGGAFGGTSPWRQ